MSESATKERVSIRITPPDNHEQGMHKRYGVPIPHALLMVDVVIRHPDGRERIHIDTAGFHIESSEPAAELAAKAAAHFWWTEGNGACDCNRALFFARAGNEPESDERPCGDTYEVIEPSWLRRPAVIEHWGNGLFQ